MRTPVIIPARLAATRLPGKPLALLGGVPMVVRVAQQAQRAVGAEQVLIATDAPAIVTAAQAHGVAATLTGPHACGTDRVAEVVGRGDAAAVVNLQGDEPFVDPRDIAALIAAIEAPAAGPGRGADMVTLAAPITSRAAWHSPSVVKVVCDDAGAALYFSRAPVPFCRAGTVPAQARQHLGLYAFRRAALMAIAAAPPHPLEQVEGLEQLRALALGLRIAVLPARGRQAGVDTPEDLARARADVASRGELAFPDIAAAQARGSL